VTGLAPDGGVEVRVDDNGCGIDEDSLEQIFVPFFTTKAEGKGTGLGLSIVRNIVVAHGGEIVAESQPRPSTAEACAEDPPTVTAFILRFPRR
jgi:signal transduction histidine kinase